MYTWFLDFFFIFRNVLVGDYILDIGSHNGYIDLYIGHRLNSNLESRHIVPRSLEMDVYVDYICNSVPIQFLVESYLLGG